MKRFFLTIIGVGLAIVSWAQPNDCNEAVPGCTTPTFGIVPPDPLTNNFDFGTGTVSNPTTPPYGTNSGCLLSGETSSTFITISIVSNGTLAWSIIGLNPNGTPSNMGCFDWIMWPYNPPVSGGVSSTCTMLQNGTIAPVACNWNGACNGNTGMAPANNLPPMGSNTSYVDPMNVTAGQTFLLCLSNYSGTSQDVNLNFFGTASVSCTPTTPDQTICQGSSANVVITTNGLPSPTFNWLVTTGVPNATAGPNVTITPPVTTTYEVVVEQLATTTDPYTIDTIVFTVTVVPPPAPNAGPDQTVCLSTPIQLTGTPSSTSNTANWQVIVPATTPPSTATVFPNFSSMTPSITVNNPGTYKFVLRESNAACGMVRDTVVVVVSELAVTATPTSPSCFGYSDGQIALASAGANEYSFNGGSSWQPGTTMGGFAAGTYSVCARNTLGCQKCANVTVTNPPPVIVQLSNDTLICENGTASLAANATGGTSYTFNWGHTASTLGSQAVSPSQDTYYDIVATSQVGCNSTADSVFVAIRPPLSATITPDQSVCPGYPGVITVVGNGGLGAPYTYTWNTGEIHTNANSSITESPQVTTMYTVLVEDGCESTPFVINSQLTTYPVPVPQIIVDEPIKCEPAVYTITNTTDPSMSAGTYWRISDGQEFLNMDEIVPDDLMASSYDVTLSVISPDGCIDSTTFDNFLLVKPKPHADFKWSPDPITMYNTEAKFSNYTFGGDTYEWFFQDAIPVTSTSKHPEVIFPDGVVGHYAVRLIATSDLGCTDTIDRIIPVVPEVLIFAPNSFTPDGDEFNQSWKVSMEGIDRYNFELKIYNRWGEVVWESHDLNASWDGTYKGKIVPEGVYNWTIRTKDLQNDGKHEYQGNINLIR